MRQKDLRKTFLKRENLGFFFFFLLSSIHPKKKIQNFIFQFSIAFVKMFKILFKLPYMFLIFPYFLSLQIHVACSFWEED